MSMLSTNNNENTEEQFNSEVAEKMLNNENQKESKKVKVYPNPNNGTFTLEVSDSYLDGEMMLFDTYGKMLYLETVKQNKMQIMRNLERGVYYVTIVNGNNKHVEKIIVQ
jgi:muramoyltetrapeptide carboxypeptidase LdcA involved in peptidoglycan recycling